VSRRGAILAGAAVGLAVLLVGGDRVAAAAAERAVSAEVVSAVGQVSSVSTQVHGVPLLTQVASGSLDHVTVQLDGVEAGGVPIDSLVVDVYDVATTSPRRAGRVEAVATVSIETVQAQAGEGWDVAVDGEALLVTSTGLLPVQARLVPTVTDGSLGFDLASVRIFGVTVDGDAVPDEVAAAVAGLDADLSDLPLGLEPTSVVVTPEGVVLSAAGTAVDLEGDR